MHKSPYVLSNLIGIALVSVIILPLVIWHLNLSIVEATYDGSASGTLASQPFELFVFFAVVWLGVVTWLRTASQPDKALETLIPIILPFLVCLDLSFIQVETFHTRSSDYMCYENAARAVLANTNPFVGSPACYLYPPLLAQVLAFLHQVAIYNPFLAFNNEAQAWTVVAYFYQCAQFLQVVLAYWLMTLLAESLRIKRLPASLLIAALFLFNYPLTRTLTFAQVNLWILNSFLLGIILLRHRPLWGGLAIALGAHIKLYTVIFLLPWSFTRRWQAILGLMLGLVGIAFIQTQGGHNWTLWQEFLIYFKSPEKPSNYRNNGIWSLMFNLAKVPERFLHTEAILNFVPIIVLGINFLVLLWFAVRFVQRERIYVRLSSTIKNGEGNSWNYIFRFYGHSIDAIAFSLLISPSVWEHHYVIVLPLALWAIVTRHDDQPGLAFIGTFLIFCIPTFEIFPLSFHRLAGLLILTYVTAPSAVQAYFLRQRDDESWLKAGNRIRL